MPTPDDSLASDSLASFAAVLAGELPGQWSSQYHPDRGGNADLTADIWDMDQVADAMAEYIVDHCAVLTRHVDGIRLFVMDRKGHDDGFLIATMAPEDLPVEAFRGVREPDGIAVEANPFHAAKHVTLRLLPRYEKALAQVRDNASRLATNPVDDPRVVMTWSEDNLVVPRPERADVAQVLSEHGFVLDADRDVFVLSGDDTAKQAASVRAAGHRLAELGVGAFLRHPPARPVPGTTPAQQPTPTRPASHRSR